jgi:hypothetical protein
MYTTHITLATLFLCTREHVHKPRVTLRQQQTEVVDIAHISSWRAYSDVGYAPGGRSLACCVQIGAHEHANERLRSTARTTRAAIER